MNHDTDEDPSAGLDRGTKRRKSGKDVESSIDSSLPMQRSLVILLKIQTCNKIKSSSREIMMNNPLTRRLPKNDIRNKTAYTSHSDPHGIIYVDQFKRKRLMGTDELYKFSDGMPYDVWTALHDIAGGIRMEYLPMRK
ncbi:hypothetical protein Tco_0260351 [Tanacetum coccineum]